MTTIKLYRDDNGVRQLQNQNEAGPVTEDVEVVQPYPAVKTMAPKPFEEQARPVTSRPYTESPHTPEPHSRGESDRRRRQRRRRNEPVLLDTRSRHERRTRLRRRNDSVPAAGETETGPDSIPPGFGVDRRI